MRGGRGGGLRGAGFLCACVEPGDAGVAAEPGLLAAGEPPGGLDRLQAGFIQGPLAVQVAEQLLVAERAAGGPALAQALGGQAAHFGFQARLPHPVDPGGDPAVKFGAGQREADLDRRAVLLVGRHGRGERAPGDLDHLQGADDPASVARQDRAGRGRVEGGQPGVQGGRAEPGELVFQAGADNPVRSGKIQVVQGRTDVQAGAADEDGHPAAGRDLLDRGAGELGVVGHVRGLGHRPDVEQVMRDALPGGFGLLGGADVHALVELHRVGVHDLAAERPGQLDGQPGLPGGGRPYHGDDVRAHPPSVPSPADLAGTDLRHRSDRDLWRFARNVALTDSPAKRVSM